MSRLFRLALESRKPLAIIIKGNPKYLNDPDVKPKTDAFYKEVQSILEKRGYSVEFDPGEEYTSPNEKADLWVGHSRGIDRLRFAPKDVKTIALQTKNYDKPYAKNQAGIDMIGKDPDHYKFSEKDLENLLNA